MKPSSHSSPVYQVDSVPLLDVNRGNAALHDEILQAIANVCASGRFLHGPDVCRLEQSVAQLCQTKHAIGCASGSDALLLSLMALDVGPGDEVIVPSFTFFATASAVWRLGAKIVFADIDPLTFNIDPGAVEKAITSATKAIIPVHLFGQCAEMDALNEIANRHGVAVIEDACQSIGARYNDRPAGSLGDAGCFSFYPTKNLGAFGDGGMLTTNDDGLAEKLRLLASHGMNPRYYHSIVGINSRLDSIQAAVLNVKFQHLSQATESRQANAQRYCQLFADRGLTDVIELPRTTAGCHHVWNQFAIRVTKGHRDALRSYLAARNIGTEIYYPVPLHLQICFKDCGFAKSSLPETEQASHEVLNLPIFPELTSREQETVVDALATYFADRKSEAA
jgi:dTDP-4-amino-4,6-dideoxygalactose transaminase